MGRTTTTAAVTKRAKGAGKSSRGSAKANTRSTKRFPRLQALGFGLLPGSSTNISLQNLIEDLRLRRSEITRGTYVAHFVRGALSVTLTKSDRETLRSFYNAVLKEVQRWSRIVK